MTLREKMFSAFFDSWKLVTKNKDAGDCCTNEFAIIYCLPHTKEEQLHALSWLVVAGIPRRHPDETMWYYSVDRTSRDQFVPYLCYLSGRQVADKPLAKLYFKRLLWQHAKHAYLCTWNTRRNHVWKLEADHKAKATPDVAWNYGWKLPDICGPDIWAAYIRGLLQHFFLARLLLPVLYPVLCILDVYSFLDNLLFYVRAKLLKHPIGKTSQPGAIDHDKKNSMLISHISATKMGSPLSLLAWYLCKDLYLQAADSFYGQTDEPCLHLALQKLVKK